MILFQEKRIMTAYRYLKPIAVFAPADGLVRHISD